LRIEKTILYFYKKEDHFHDEQNFYLPKISEKKNLRKISPRIIFCRDKKFSNWIKLKENFSTIASNLLQRERGEELFSNRILAKIFLPLTVKKNESFPKNPT
jgi:hypothetical protein